MFKRIINAGLALSLAIAANTSMASDGAAIYNRSCKMCHGSGMMGAPKVGDKAAWAPLIEQGTDALLASTRSGKGKMMPRGGCRTCSDEDLSAAIGHMIEMSK
ncbi:MAG: cytochrome c5 family protein [Gammaproteobacteria bacterium]|nr:cytochrome c5 family protein [Gammaproteobacteria bacterium]